MAIIRNVSFRDQTLGGLADLLADEGLTCAQSQNLLAYIAGELLDYKEEGVSVVPDVIFCENVATLLTAIPGGMSYKIGELELCVESGKRILKDCAVLAANRWSIYIERKDQSTLTYGIATYPFVPGSLTIFDAIELNKEILAVIIQKTSDKTIKIVGSKGSKLTWLFSTSREIANETGATSLISEAICTDLQEDEKVEFSRYLRISFDSLMRSSHGCIVGVLNKDIAALPAEIRDCIILDPPVDFHLAFQNFRGARGSADLARLQACYGLIQGLLRSDGMVLFDKSGRVVGYRAFYRPAEANSTSTAVVGGARRRAFEGAKSLVGQGLHALLFRSQDGLTLYHGIQS